MLNNDTIIGEKISKQLNMFQDVNAEVIPHILDLEEYFASIESPIIINEIPLKANFMQDIIDCIADSTKRDGDIISCECGHLQGKYYEGLTCEKCSSIVSSQIIKSFTNEVWFSLDDFGIKIINPLVYLVLSFSLKERNSNSNSYLKYILDVTLEYPDDLKDAFTGQGFKYFQENFDYIIDFFVYTYPKTKKRKNIELLKVFVDKFRDRIFTSKLPIMSKFVQPITKAGYSLRYADESLKEIMQAVLAVIFSKYSNVIETNKNKQLEKNIYRMFDASQRYIQKTIETKFKKKEAYFRRNIFGTKLHWTFRCVISPICTTHMGDEIQIPWKVGLTTLLYHVLGIMINRMGFVPTDAYQRVMKSYYRYDPLIDQIFQLLIIESRFKGLPVLVNRNPTLLPSGTFMAFIVKVKNEHTKISRQFIQNFGRGDYSKVSTAYKYTHDEIYHTRKLIQKGSNGYDDIGTIRGIDYDKFIGFLDKENDELESWDMSIADKTIAVSYLIAKLVNLDFDGDHTDNALVIENDLAEEMLNRIHPSSFFVGNGQMEIGGGVLFPKQHVLTLNLWLKDNN